MYDTTYYDIMLYTYKVITTVIINILNKIIIKTFWYLYDVVSSKTDYNYTMTTINN